MAMDAKETRSLRRALCLLAAVLLPLLLLTALCACRGTTPPDPVDPADSATEPAGTAAPVVTDAPTDPPAETAGEPDESGTDEPAETQPVTEPDTEPVTEPETEEEETTPAWDTNPCKLYVATDGNDGNDGSEGAPFATIEAAIAAVRGIDKSAYTSITVYIAPGDYRTRQLSFLAEDSGTESCRVTYRAQKRGTVTVNGGVSVPYASFTPVSDPDVLARLSEDARANVKCFDLTTLGLTADDWGRVSVKGTYNTSRYYDDYVAGSSCEVFFNDNRMTLARYPNDKDLATGRVISVGYNASNPDFESTRNPVGDTYQLSASLAERVAGWRTLEGVWMYGFWVYDWADASTPIAAFDADARTITTKFVSRYGAKSGAPYYFFNVFEELDTAGEWFLDRENGILYVYPPKGMTDGTVDVSIADRALVACWKADYLTFDGLIVCGTRDTGISFNGSHCTAKNCVVKNVAGHGILGSGTDILVQKCEVAHTGMCGIALTGGDTATLTPGGNVADNNYVHDWSELTQTYQAGVALYGVGNTASHNELDNSPHLGIYYEGNNHVIEYNVIRNVCRLSSDAGAIYAGASWTYYGNVIRYNLIDSPGAGKFTPNGIYFDDALSGQTAYGNILYNVPGNAFLLGGGRDLNVYNNLIISTKNANPITYDARAIEGIVSGGWFVQAKEGGALWKGLDAVPWRDTTWQTAFPAMQGWSVDFADVNDPAFLPNPANSRVTGNLIVSRIKNTAELSDIAASVKKYSDVSGNVILTYKTGLLETLFTDPEAGDYTLLPDGDARRLLPDFVDIPCAEIGRYGW